MIKNVLPSLRQRAGPQRICSRQKSIRSGTARDSFSQTPHMRGKVLDGVKVILVLGITPACAGKSPLQFEADVANKDHPRMCGEKRLLHFFGFCVIGSPPHVRGKARVCLFLGLPLRITPACAGKSISGHLCGGQFQDHPRMCGEKFIISRYLCLLSRITPACAGKRLSASPFLLCP